MELSLIIGIHFTVLAKQIRFLQGFPHEDDEQALSARNPQWNLPLQEGFQAANIQKAAPDDVEWDRSEGRCKFIRVRREDLYIWGVLREAEELSGVAAWYCDLWREDVRADRGDEAADIQFEAADVREDQFRAEVKGEKEAEFVHQAENGVLILR